MFISKRLSTGLLVLSLLVSVFAVSTEASAATFTIGQRVQVSSGPLNVRSKPSTNNSSKILGTQPTGALGSVVSGPQTGSGYTWWNINYDTGADGWSVENYLIAAAVSIIPAAPTNLSAAAGNAVVGLGFTAPTGATSYTVKRSTTNGGPYTNIATITTASYSDTTVVNGTTYYYVVSASNSAGTSANSSQVSATPVAPLSIPTAPTNLSATAGNATVALTFTASTGATSYNIKRATVSGGPYTTIANITTTSYSDTSVTNGTTYYYVVSAVSTAGESANSSQVSAMPTSGTTSSAPTPTVAWWQLDGNTADSVGTNTGTITGSPTYVTGEINQALHFGGADTMSASSLNNTSFPNTGTLAFWLNTATMASDGADLLDGYGGSRNHIYLRFCSSGNGNCSGATSGTRQMQVAFSDASNVGQFWRQSTIAENTWVHIAIVWDTVNHIGYIYQNGTLLTSGAIGSTTWVPNGENVLFGQYGFQGSLDDVRLYNTALSASDIASIYGYTGGGSTVTIPTAPTNLSATAGNASVALTFTAPTGATSYNIKRATVSGGAYTTIASVTTTSYSDTTVLNGTTYYYVVSAVNTAGESANSSQASATPVASVTIPATPTNLSATAGNASVTLGFIASSGATSYNIKRSTTTGGPYTTIASVTTTSYSDTSVTNGTTYYYVVSAVNSGGESANSSQVSAMPVAGSTLPSTGVSAVSTYNSIGLYWKPGSAPTSPSGQCGFQYRVAGSGTWFQGHYMYYDPLNFECRGSAMLLQPATTYEFQISLNGTPVRQYSQTTWTEVTNLPIAQTITLPAGTQTSCSNNIQLNITQSGTPTGYILYQTNPTTPTVYDAQNNCNLNVYINASYVILKGVTLKGAKWDAIRLYGQNVHDVIIDGNDISGYGQASGGTITDIFGSYPQGTEGDNDPGSNAIHAICEADSMGNIKNGAGYGPVANALTRVTIQHNVIHDPRYGSNSWSSGHPYGPNGIFITECAGNQVIRWNTVGLHTTNRSHFFDDGISGGENFDPYGFPGPDSDIYGNLVESVMDDAIEPVGSGANVRAWGNYTNQSNTGFSSTVVAAGPIYIFRNVMNRVRTMYNQTPDYEVANWNRNGGFKSGSSNNGGSSTCNSQGLSYYGTCGAGRRYLYNNTMLEATNSPVDGTMGTYYFGAAYGISGTGGTQLFYNTVSRNNIYDMARTDRSLAFAEEGTNNDLDYDQTNSQSIGETHGLSSSPAIYASGSGWSNESGGMYQLAPSSPGYGTGLIIPNISDMYPSPDRGAAQHGDSALCFGAACSR